MIKYDLSNIRQLRGQLRADIPKIEKAKTRAIASATKKASVFISRDIRDVYALKAYDIKHALSIKHYESSRALLYTGGSLPLSSFKPKTKRVAVTATSARGKKFKTHRRATTVRVRKDIGRKVVGRMHKTTGSAPSGPGFLTKNHVLSRRDYREHNFHDQFSLIQRYGPSIPGMVSFRGTIEGAEELIREELPKEFNRQLKYLLDGDQ